MRVRLPVDSVTDAVVGHLSTQPVVIVTAPPGSGKTTRVPPAVVRGLDSGAIATEGGGEVWLVQPRRVAATLAARRIAEEWGEAPGQTIGWSVRFDERTSARTRLVVMTEGMLLRRIQADPFLESTSVVILDEVHERSLDLDVAMALLGDMQRDARPDLRLVVMSATLDPEPLLACFGAGTPVVRASGRRFPVQVRYLPRPFTGSIAGAVAGAVRRMIETPSEAAGHVLVFLPGTGDIRRAQELLDDLKFDRSGRRVEVIPLHGRLSLAEQGRALASVSHRKVVLATNIAETSVTLEGVTCVVDSGKARQVHFEPATGVSHLETVDISQASADQRAGRAGRTEAGVALRMWTRDQQRIRRPHDIPAIRRSDLSAMLLRVLDLGLTVAALPWLETPPEPAIARGRKRLASIGALDGDGLSAMGRALATLPVHPQVGAVVLRGRELGGTRSAATAAALMSEGSPWDERDACGTDLAELVDRVDRRERGSARRKVVRVERVRDQLHRALGGAVGRRLSDAELADCLLAGFPDRLARRRAEGSSRFKLASGRGAVLRSPEVFPHGELCIAVDVQGGGRNGQREDVIHLAAAVPRAVVDQRAEWAVRVRFDEEGCRVRVEETSSIGHLELDTRNGNVGAVEEAVTELLVDAAARRLDEALSLDETTRNWLARVRFVSHHRPDLALPCLDSGALLDVIRDMAPGCRSFSDLHQKGVGAFVRGRLSWTQQQAVEALAPVALTLPTGSRCRLQYSAPDRPPVLAARIQQLFGWTHTPRVVDGQVPVLLHLLAPNHRPAQVTDDLASFWSTTWDEVRRDLRGRYPKHAWPEDPRTAVAEDRPQRKRR